MNQLLWLLFAIHGDQADILGVYVGEKACYDAVRLQAPKNVGKYLTCSERGYTQEELEKPFDAVARVPVAKEPL